MTERLTGTVKRIRVDHGFGFIEAPTGIEYFFHRSAAPDFQTLLPDDRVSFTPTLSPKGPRAEAVRLELPGVDVPL
jgi:cold shock CspA family protein